MATAQQIQAKIYRGSAIEALHLGAPFQLYRPNGLNNPLSASNLRGTVNASFTASASNYGTPRGYAKPTFTCQTDGTKTQPGDYLVGPWGGVASATFFIASQELNVPILAVNCNKVVTFYRDGASSAVGMQPGYLGERRDQMTALATDWPISLLQGSRGEKGDTNLPGDTHMPRSNMIFPPSLGAALITNDICVDNDASPRRWKLSTVENTFLGWRTIAILAAS